MPLTITNVHSTRPHVGTTSQPSQMPRGAHINAISKPVKVANRTSPPAFFATMFHRAWMRPARMTSARDERGIGRDAATITIFAGHRPGHTSNGDSHGDNESRSPWRGTRYDPRIDAQGSLCREDVVRLRT